MFPAYTHNIGTPSPVVKCLSQNFLKNFFGTKKGGAGGFFFAARPIGKREREKESNQSSEMRGPRSMASTAGPSWK